MKKYAIDSRHVLRQRFWVDISLNDRECIAFIKCQMSSAYALDYEILKTQRMRKLLMAYAIDYENFRYFFKKYRMNCLFLSVIETDCHALSRYLINQLSLKNNCVGIAVIQNKGIKFVVVMNACIQIIYESTGQSYLAELRRLMAQYGYDEAYQPIDEMIVITDKNEVLLNNFPAKIIYVESIDACIDEGIAMRPQL